jgi:hypothetical protein
VNLAALLTASYVTVPSTSAPDDVTFSATVAPLTLIGFIGSLNVTVTGLVISTASAELGGNVEITAGGVVSGAVDSHPARIAAAMTIMLALRRVNLLSGFIVNNIMCGRESAKR